MSIVSHIRSWLFLSLACSVSVFGQLDSARLKIESIARQAKGLVGVAAIDLSSGDTLTVRGDDRFPMQSVFKFPLALAVLDQVDNGTMALSQTIHISKADLLPDTWSPLREAYPSDGIDLPLDSLISYTVSQSDNNGCDILFRLLGGPGVVDQYVHKLGIVNMSIVATEAEMHQEWLVQYRNWSSPFAMAKLLQMFYSGSILSQASRDYLWRVLASTRTGVKRIKGLLPAGTIVPHKTGSSGTNNEGVAAATNDIGIIAFPDGRYVVLAVFVSDSDASEEERDRVIATIARAIWNAFSPQ
jgi:beta-lactamase class A